MQSAAVANNIDTLAVLLYYTAQISVGRFSNIVNFHKMQRMAMNASPLACMPIFGRIQLGYSIIKS